MTTEKNERLDIIQVNSIKIYEPYLKIYVTKKLIACGLDASCRGFAYFRDVLMEMLRDGSERKTLRQYYSLLKPARIGNKQIDKSINLMLTLSYIKSNGFEKLSQLLGGMEIKDRTNSSLFYIFKEYIKCCLFDDYRQLVKREVRRGLSR